MTSSTLASLKGFFNKLSEATSALLIMDYDGTLAPFYQNPDDTVPYPGVLERIKTIMQRGRTKVVVVSGRDLSILKNMLQLDPLPELWGCHGGQRLLEGGTAPIEQIVNPAALPLLVQAKDIAATLAPNLICEQKAFSAGLHWRGQEPSVIQSQVPFVLEKWKMLTGKGLLELCPFEQGVEIKVAGVHKGQAVKILMNEMPSDTVIACLGDDLTDEDAFMALGDHALKVLVRKTLRPTLADIHLIPPAEVLAFLDQWITNLS